MQPDTPRGTRTHHSSEQFCDQKCQCRGSSCYLSNHVFEGWRIDASIAAHRALLEYWSFVVRRCDESPRCFHPIDKANQKSVYRGSVLRNRHLVIFQFGRCRSTVITMDIDLPTLDSIWWRVEFQTWVFNISRRYDRQHRSARDCWDEVRKIADHQRIRKAQQ